MADQFRITGRPEVNTSSGREPALGVFARPSSGGPLPTADNRLQGLIQGLQSFNPALQQWAQSDEQKGRQAAVDKANADAQSVEHPVDALTGAPVQRPEAVPPAFDAEYRRAYGVALAQRAAINTRAQLSTAYEDQKNTEGFDLDKFLGEARQQALQGVSDPLLQGAIGAHLSETEAAIRSDYTNLTVQRHEQNRMATAVQLADGFTAEKSPQELAQMHFDWYLPQLNKIGVDKKQAAALFLGQLNRLSDAGGGRPELYDAMMSDAGPNGTSVISWNPQLEASVREARDHATLIRTRALHEATEVDRFRTDAGLGDDVMQKPETVTLDRLVPLIGPNGLSAEKAASYYHEAQVQLGKKAAMDTMMLDAEQGKLGYYKTEDQQKVLDAKLGPAAYQMWTAATQGDAQSVAALGQRLLEAHSRYRSTVPVGQLARLIETNVSALPNPEGPDANFKASAAIYRALAPNPQYRDMYFKGDAAKVMEAFSKRMETGVDEKTAYDSAYRLVDPEFQAAARKRAEDPAMQATITKMASKYTDGSSWVPTWLGGAGRPENTHTLGAWATGAVREELMQNPDLTDSELQDHIERAAAKNFALDSTSQLAVKVPPQFAGANLGEALSDYSKDMQGLRQTAGKWTENSRIQYQPLDDRGTYRVQQWDGTRTTDVGTATIQDIVSRSASKHILTKEEGNQLFALKQAVKNGQPIPAVDAAVIAKGTSTGYLKESEAKALQDASAAQVLGRLKQIPNMGLGAPTGNYTEVPRRGNAVVDNQLTSSIALDLFNGTGLTGGPFSGSTDNGLGLASSLTAMREGIALRAYQDPNPDAGMNIGAGYNLKAHADVVNADLKRSGVPEDRIEDVKTGKAQLTSDQAKRLLQVSLARYSTAAQKVADSVSAGLWERMLPAQRAVMTDIAYQTGDASQFKHAWAALAAGDTATFVKEIKTTYVNNAGARVEDTRATDLRASLLAGGSYWKSRVSLAGSRPSNAIQAAAQVASAK
jgi:hypothetical protein